MFVDASVLVAILNEEGVCEALSADLEAVPGPLRVSPLVRFETVLALSKASASRLGRRSDADTLEQARRTVDALFDGLGVTHIPITPEIGDAALRAAARYGKAVGHPAALTFGDCFACACAASLGAGLLYKGDDFARTDLA